MNIGIVSGFFNPLHLGHLEYIEAAKQLSDKLVCIVNNDDQVSLKGTKKFLEQGHRYKIMQSIKYIDLCVMSIDTNSGVIDTLQSIRELFKYDNLTFYNSGDRKPEEGSNVNKQIINSFEVRYCGSANIDVKYLDLPKIYSSREILS